MTPYCVDCYWDLLCLPYRPEKSEKDEEGKLRPVNAKCYLDNKQQLERNAKMRLEQ